MVSICVNILTLWKPTAPLENTDFIFQIVNPSLYFASHITVNIISDSLIAYLLF